MYTWVLISPVYLLHQIWIWDQSAIDLGVAMLDLYNGNVCAANRYEGRDRLVCVKPSLRLHELIIDIYLLLFTQKNIHCDKTVV